MWSWLRGVALCCLSLFPQLPLPPGLCLSSASPSRLVSAFPRLPLPPGLCFVSRLLLASLLSSSPPLSAGSSAHAVFLSFEQVSLVTLDDCLSLRHY